MGRFQVISDAVAVAEGRLVTIVSVDPDGTVTVRDLANGRVHTTSAVELSSRPTCKRHQHIWCNGGSVGTRTTAQGGDCQH